MNAPELYYLSPEWDKRGRLTRDSLVWNALNGNHEKVAAWSESLSKIVSLSKGWVPPITMLEQGKPADFIAACRTTFAVSPAAWKAIRDLVESTAEALPVKVTHAFTAEGFDFQPIASAKQPAYLLLHGLFELNFGHGQRGTWDVNRNRYDMSIGSMYGAKPEACKDLWLDPAEFSGKHLFLLRGEWIASAEFVDRVRAAKLSGLVFHPIKYVVKGSPTAIAVKEQPAPPKPDFASAAKGYSPTVAKQWQALWSWTVQALQNRGWPAKKPTVKPPLPMKKVRDFEAKHGIKLPNDYVDALTKFASEVTVDQGRVESDKPAYRQLDEVKRRMRELMFGGETTLWSFATPVREYAGFKKWGNSMADENPDDDYHQHFRNKLPILHIRNGDLIVLDLQTGVPTYLSHEGDEELQRMPLGKNFTDFITRWSWAGLPWPDFLPGTEFYDQRTKRIPDSSSALSTWRAWLRGLPLPKEKG